MKKWLAVILTLCLMMGVMPVSAAETTVYDLATQSELVKIVGRTEVTADGIVPYTTGAGMAFYADCAGDITLTVAGSSARWESLCLSVFVDGVEQERVMVDCPNSSVTTSELTVATGLSQGMHRIEVYRDSEEVYGTMTFASLALNGTISPVPEAPLMIEFIGDSLTCGYASYPLEDKSLSVEHPLWEAGSRSFAFLTAKALGADFQSVCASGYGIVCGWNNDRVTLGDMYDYASYYYSDNEWLFERTADVVVINLGTNDDARKGSWNKSDEDIGDGARALIEQVRSHNPDAKIVWVSGMAGVKFKEQITRHIEELGGADAGYYFAELPYGMSSDGGHPTLEEHAAASEALTTFLTTEVLDAEMSAVMTAEAASRIDVSALDAGLAAKLALEIDIARNTDGAAGVLTALCEENGWQPVAEQSPTADVATTETNAEEESPWLMIVIIAAAAVLVIGMIVFAVVYKPKKKA